MTSFEIKFSAVSGPRENLIMAEWEAEEFDFDRMYEDELQMLREQPFEGRNLLGECILTLSLLRPAPSLQVLVFE